MANFLDKTKAQASEIYAEVQQYLVDTFSQAGKVFTNSSAYGQILGVISQITSMILFFIEDSITELNIMTASRTQNIQGLARLTGHNPTRAIAATGEVSLNMSSLPNIVGKYIVIPNYSKLKCVNNGKIYMLNLIDDQVRIDITAGKTYYAQIVQGEIQNQTFTSDGSILQSYSVITNNNTLVDNFFVKVYVNSVQWKAYDSIYDIPFGANGYLVKTGISGGIDIYFGNGNFGAVPPTGAEIRVEYLLTGGYGGNILESTDVTFQWIDVGYSIVGDEVDLNEYLNTQMSQIVTFGSNPETAAMTRLLAPRTSRSFVLANPENYIVFLQKFNYFSIVDAFTTFGDDYIDDDNVIYLYLVPDITKKLQNTENYFTVPESYFTLSEQEKTKVLNLIENSGSKIVTSIVKIVEPQVSRYVLNISLIVFEGYSVDVIKSNIISDLSSYFLSVQRRELIPQSDVVKIVENVKGVDAVNVSFLSEQNEISKSLDANNSLVGLDELGNIVIAKEEIPLIRGGWYDRNGIYYADGIYDDRPCSINISIKSTTTQNINTKLFQQSISNIMRG